MSDASLRRALVTGGAGFVGSHVAEALLECDYDVVIADDLSTGKRSNIPSGARFVECDISSQAFRDLLQREVPAVVAHLAAQIDVRKSIEEPVRDAGTNIVAFIAMMEVLARVSPGCRVVLTSTAGVYGDAPNPPLSEETRLSPLSPYAISKAAAENYLDYYSRICGVGGVILRFANVYGPRQDPKGEAGVVSIFCSRVRNGLPITVFGDGNQTRDYVFVKDVAAAIVAALEMRFDSRTSGAPVFNIGTGRATSVLDLVKAIEAVAHRKTEVEFAPLRPGEIIDSALDASRARSALGWIPEAELEAGLAVTYAAIPD